MFNHSITQPSSSSVLQHTCIEGIPDVKACYIAECVQIRLNIADQSCVVHSQMLGNLTSHAFIHQEQFSLCLQGQNNGLRFSCIQFLPQSMARERLATACLLIQVAALTSSAPGCPAPSMTSSSQTASGISNSPYSRGSKSNWSIRAKLMRGEALLTTLTAGSTSSRQPSPLRNLRHRSE